MVEVIHLARGNCLGCDGALLPRAFQRRMIQVDFGRVAQVIRHDVGIDRDTAVAAALEVDIVVHRIGCRVVLAAACFHAAGHIGLRLVVDRGIELGAAGADDGCRQGVSRHIHIVAVD